jgi:L-glyceraldehyde 3-phosphate reductase
VSVPPVPRTALGRSGIQVSRLALGSWRTYERISRDQGLAVMRAAREAGINFLDDARYNDETGDAPLPTGYSEVVFGELFRAAGWRRDDTVVSNKLWWEFWPDESPAQELASSLGRMGFDYVDLIYSEVLLNPSVTTVLFGATRPGQVRANLGAPAVAARLTPDERDRLAAVGT